MTSGMKNTPDISSTPTSCASSAQSQLSCDLNVTNRPQLACSSFNDAISSSQHTGQQALETSGHQLQCRDTELCEVLRTEHRQIMALLQTLQGEVSLVRSQCTQLLDLYKPSFAQPRTASMGSKPAVITRAMSVVNRPSASPKKDAALSGKSTTTPGKPSVNQHPSVSNSPISGSISTPRKRKRIMQLGLTEVRPQRSKSFAKHISSKISGKPKKGVNSQVEDTPPPPQYSNGPARTAIQDTVVAPGSLDEAKRLMSTMSEQSQAARALDQRVRLRASSFVALPGLAKQLKPDRGHFSASSETHYDVLPALPPRPIHARASDDNLVVQAMPDPVGRPMLSRNASSYSEYAVMSGSVGAHHSSKTSQQNSASDSDPLNTDATFVTEARDPSHQSTHAFSTRTNYQRLNPHRESLNEVYFEKDEVESCYDHVDNRSILSDNYSIATEDLGSIASASRHQISSHGRDANRADNACSNTVRHSSNKPLDFGAAGEREVSSFTPTAPPSRGPSSLDSDVRYVRVRRLGNDEIMYDDSVSSSESDTFDVAHDDCPPSKRPKPVNRHRYPSDIMLYPGQVAGKEDLYCSYISAAELRSRRGTWPAAPQSPRNCNLPRKQVNMPSRLSETEVVIRKAPGGAHNAVNHPDRKHARVNGPVTISSDFRLQAMSGKENFPSGHSRARSKPPDRPAAAGQSQTFKQAGNNINGSVPVEQAQWVPAPAIRYATVSSRYSPRPPHKH